VKKPEDLRRHLEANVPEFKEHPDKLHVFIEKGSVSCRIGGGISFMYRYTLSLLVTDYSRHADTLFIPINAWLVQNQPDLLQNPDKLAHGYRFEAEILDHTTADISIELDLTESVVVTQENGRYQAEHLAEPILPDLDGPTGWALYINGSPIDQL
jgi:hypothetical protein